MHPDQFGPSSAPERHATKEKHRNMIHENQRFHGQERGEYVSTTVEPINLICELNHIIE